jgi:NADH-dependent peroxiredoxin subunit F
MKELIIIGGGPAGITAGIYAARKYINTLLIAKDFTGQIGSSAWVENYPGFKKISGLELIKSFKEHLELFKNIETKSFQQVEKVKKIKNGFEVTTDEGSYQAKSLIIATGGVPKKLNAENEFAFLGKGLSYCVTCDGANFKNKVVAIIGGGNAGAETAIELGRYSRKVYLLEYEKNLCADKILQLQLKRNKKIAVITSVQVKSFEGRKELEKVIYCDLKNKATKELKVDGCFIETGSIPNTDFVNGFLDLNKKGEIKVNPATLEASVTGVFTAGDVNDLSGKQIVIACGQGATAVLAVYNYLQKNTK